MSGLMGDISQFKEEIRGDVSKYKEGLRKKTGKLIIYSSGKSRPKLRISLLD